MLSNYYCFAGHEIHISHNVPKATLITLSYIDILYAKLGVWVQVQICRKRTPSFSNQATGLAYQCEHTIETVNEVEKATRDQDSNT